jgi:hypothetical protein
MAPRRRLRSRRKGDGRCSVTYNHSPLDIDLTGEDFQVNDGPQQYRGYWAIDAGNVSFSRFTGSEPVGDHVQHIGPSACLDRSIMWIKATRILEGGVEDVTITLHDDDVNYIIPVDWIQQRCDEAAMESGPDEDYIEDF